MAKMYERLISVLDAATKKDFPALSTYDGIRRVLVKTEGEGFLQYQIREDYRGIFPNDPPEYSEFFQAVTIADTTEGAYFVPWVSSDAPALSIGAKKIEKEADIDFILDVLRIKKYVLS